MLASSFQSDESKRSLPLTLPGSEDGFLQIPALEAEEIFGTNSAVCVEVEILVAKCEWYSDLIKE